MRLVNFGGHMIIFGDEFGNAFVLDKITRLLLNRKRRAFFVDAIKIRGVRGIINAAALNRVEIKRPIAAEFHVEANVGKSFSFAEENAADVRNNIFYRETLLDEFGGGYREIFCPIETGQVGKIFFGRENFFIVLNKIGAAEGKLNRVVGEDRHEFLQKIFRAEVVALGNPNQIALSRLDTFAPLIEDAAGIFFVEEEPRLFPVQGMKIFQDVAA